MNVSLPFDQARRTFERMRQVAKDRLQGLEYYSTTLWHLKQDVWARR